MTRLRIRKGREPHDWTIRLLDDEGNDIGELENVRGLSITCDPDSPDWPEPKVTLDMCPLSVELDIEGDAEINS